MLIYNYFFKIYLNKNQILEGTYPEVKESLTAYKTIVIGDMHGSTRKLLELLILAEYITLSKDKLERFTALYIQTCKLLSAHKIIQLDRQHRPYFDSTSAPEMIRLQSWFQEMLEILNSISWIGGTRNIILLGDLICERSPYDLLILEFLEKLESILPEKNQLRILLSNHDWAAISSHIKIKNLTKQSNILFDTPYTHAKNHSWQNSFLFQELYGGYEAIEHKYINHLKRLELCMYNPMEHLFFTHTLLSNNPGSGLCGWSNLWTKLLQNISAEKETDLPIICNKANRFVLDTISSFTQFDSLNQDEKLALLSNIMLIDRLLSYANQDDEYSFSSILEQYNVPDTTYIHGHSFYQNPQQTVIHNTKNIQSINLNNHCRQGLEFEQKSFETITELQQAVLELPRKYICPVFVY
jgi:hypothetical protein